MVEIEEEKSRGRKPGRRGGGVGVNCRLGIRNRISDLFFISQARLEPIKP